MLKYMWGSFHLHSVIFIWYHCQFSWRREGCEQEGGMCYHSNKLTHWQDCTIYLTYGVSAADDGHWSAMALCCWWHREGRRRPCWSKELQHPQLRVGDDGESGRGECDHGCFILLNAAMFIVSPNGADTSLWLVYWLVYINHFLFYENLFSFFSGWASVIFQN